VVRNLRRAEALVTQAVLAGDASDSRSARLPRRTRQTVLRRLEAWGWFRERWVPNLAALGHRRLAFDLTRPFADDRRAVLDRLRSLPETLLLWAGPETLITVRAAGPSEIGVSRSPGSEFLRSGASSTLLADPAEGEVPAYFDFEAAWVRRWGLGATRTYPQPYPGGLPAGASEDDPRPTDAEARVVRSLIAPGADERPDASSALSREPWVSRCVQKGWVTLRTFLDPLAVARRIEGFPTQLVFLRGSLRPGARPDQPFHDVVADCGVGPFLFATDGKDVLIGALAMGPGPAGLGGPAPRAPVLATLQRSTRGISVVREPLASLDVWVDHEYGRLVGVAELTRSAEPAPRPAERRPDGRGVRGAARSG
jgi:hypothetical protein